jgi:pimeloyl-ACP methyl ester carboxylesterase
VPIRPQFISFSTSDGVLGALRWPGIEGAPTVLAVHGLTGNSWHFDPLAHHLAGGADVVALDLRGRFRSYPHEGPFGIRQHARDVAAIARELGGRVTLVGYSMGAFVCLLAAEQHPELFSGLLLVDGGTATELPEGRDPDEWLDESLGPAIERLQTVWPDRVSYNTMWAQQPAFADGIGIDLERNLLADLVEIPGGFRTAVNEAAVRTDGRDLLVDDEIRSLLADRTTPTSILRAPNGPLGTPPPSIDEATVASLPQHRWTTVAGTNHSTILLGRSGAPVVADAIRAELSRSADMP